MICPALPPPLRLTANDAWLRCAGGAPGDRGQDEVARVEQPGRLRLQLLEVLGRRQASSGTWRPSDWRRPGRRELARRARAPGREQAAAGELAEAGLELAGAGSSVVDAGGELAAAAGELVDARRERGVAGAELARCRPAARWSRRRAGSGRSTAGRPGWRTPRRRRPRPRACRRSARARTPGRRPPGGPRRRRPAASVLPALVGQLRRSPPRPGRAGRSGPGSRPRRP